MIDSELFQFMDVFRLVQRVFPLRGAEHELTEVGRAYFKAMRRFSLSDVQSGADAYIAKGERFPKPGQWIAAIPNRKRTVDVRVMLEAEAREYRRAEALFYEDIACHCKLCVAADITHKPIRFVPEFDVEADVELTVQDPIGNRLVVAGHWAHGEELARVYKAKADFYDAFYRAIGTARMDAQQQRPKLGFHERIEAIYAKPAQTPTV